MTGRCLAAQAPSAARRYRLPRLPVRAVSRRGRWGRPGFCQRHVRRPAGLVACSEARQTLLAALGIRYLRLPRATVCPACCRLSGPPPRLIAAHSRCLFAQDPRRPAERGLAAAARSRRPAAAAPWRRRHGGRARLFGRAHGGAHRRGSLPNRSADHPGGTRAERPTQGAAHGRGTAVGASWGVGVGGRPGQHACKHSRPAVNVLLQLRSMTCRISVSSFCHALQTSTEAAQLPSPLAALQPSLTPPPSAFLFHRPPTVQY